MASTVRIALLAVVLALVSPAQAGAVELGGLTELPGTAGCLTPDGAIDATPGLCTAAPEGANPNSLLISPDGRFAYVNGASPISNVTTLARDPATGALSPIAGADYCHSYDGEGAGGAGTCTDARAIGIGNEGDSMAMSQDGTSLYVGSGNGSLAIFSRDAASGKLTQLGGTDGCLSVDGASEEGAGTCTDVRALQGVYSVTLSPDDRFAYVVSIVGTAYAVAIFSRDTGTGKLTQLSGTDGCWSDDGTSDDGADTCHNSHGGGYANNFAITPTGRHAFWAHYEQDALAIMGRDPVTGTLSQAAGVSGCLSMDGGSEDGAGTCQDVGVLSGVFSAWVSVDGATLYASAYTEPGISIFRIDPTSGALTPLPGTDHCWTNDGDSSEGAATCSDGRGFDGSEQMTLSADGRSLYHANYGEGVLAFSLDPATGKATQHPGIEGCFTADGSSLDGANTCTDIRAVGGGYRVALSPDNGFAYLPSGDGSGSITALSRQASPVCAGAAGTTTFATPLALTLTCSDPNGDPFTREVVTAPAHGSLGPIDQATGNVTFTPAAAFSGADAFTFRAVDAVSAGAPATAAVTVSADTVAPTCKRKGAAKLSRKTVVVSFRCGEAARLAAKLTLPRKVARKQKLAAAKKITIASGKANAAANKTTKVKLKLKPKARKRLRGLGKRALRKLRPTLSITATDKAGNRRKQAKKLRLKR